MTTPAANPRPPFLHHHLVQRITGDFSRHPVQIRGARAIGKSTVLDAIADGLGIDRGHIVRGREPEAKAELAKTLDGSGPVLVDDLDEMFKDEEVHDMLARLIGAGRRTIVTSTMPPDLSLLVETHAYIQTPNLPPERHRAWSDFTQQFQPEEIDPWPAVWHQRTIDLVKQVLDPKLRQNGTLVSEWTTAVVQLTGGHPALLDAAFLEIARLHGPRSTADDAAQIPLDLPSARRRAQVYAHLEEALFSSMAFRRVRRVAKEMRLQAPRAYDHLVQNAADASVSEFDAPVELKRVLIDSAIVYRSAQSKKLVVAGELLRRLLGGSPEARRPAVHVIADPADEERGTIHVALGGRTTVLDVRGKTWKIVKTLNAGRNEAVAVKTLMDAAGVDPTGIRSAIQRLKNDFLAAGLEGVVDNVWGHGYRLSDFPLIAMPPEPEK